MKCLNLVAVLFLVSVSGGAATGQDSLPAIENLGDPPPPEQPAVAEENEALKAPPDGFRITPIASAMADFSQLVALREFAVQQFGEQFMEESPISDLMIVHMPLMAGNVPELDSGAAHRSMRFELYASRPAFENYMDFVVPRFSETLSEMLGDAGAEVQEQSPGVFRAGDQMCVQGAQHLAMCQADWPLSEMEINRLKKLLHEVEERRSPHLFSVSVKPTEIERSFLRAEIAGLRAFLGAEAQRRDDDDEFSAAARSAGMQTVSDLFDAFFHDTQQVSFDLDFDSADQSLTVQLVIVAEKKSALEKSIAELKQQRARTLAWLHPDASQFLTASVPLPKPVANAFPDLAAGSMEALARELSLTATSTQTVRAVAQQIQENCRIEVLMQTIPVPDAVPVSVIVMPLNGAGQLDADVLQMVSAIGGTAVHTIGDVNGWPVHAIGTQEVEPSGSVSVSPGLSFVLTDECLAVMFGSEQQLGTLEAVLKREFASGEDVQRFHQCLLAGRTTARSAGDWAFPLTILDDLMGSSGGATALELGQKLIEMHNSVEESGSVRETLDTMEVSVQTGPGEIIFQLRCQRDAVFSGCAVWQTGIELLTHILEAVND
ncbi:MAG: hypothetical protein R3C49_11280 [Planctomycetaceae bacterium]